MCVERGSAGIAAGGLTERPCEPGEGDRCDGGGLGVGQSREVVQQFRAVDAHPDCAGCVKMRWSAAMADRGGRDSPKLITHRQMKNGRSCLRREGDLR